MVRSNLELSYHQALLRTHYIDVREEEFVDSALGNPSPACIDASERIRGHGNPYSEPSGPRKSRRWRRVQWCGNRNGDFPPKRKSQTSIVAQGRCAATKIRF